MFKVQLAAPSRTDAVLASSVTWTNQVTQQEKEMQLPEDPNAIVALIFGAIVGIRFIVWSVESIPDCELTAEDRLDFIENNPPRPE